MNGLVTQPRWGEGKGEEGEAAQVARAASLFYKTADILWTKS